MLVLSRKKNQGILVRGKDGDLRVVVLEAEKGKVRLGIEGPRGYVIAREELVLEIRDANKQSAVRDLTQIRTILGGQSE